MQDVAIFEIISETNQRKHFLQVSHSSVIAAFYLTKSHFPSFAYLPVFSVFYPFQVQFNSKYRLSVSSFSFRKFRR